VAAHGADSHAEAIHRDRACFSPEDLVGLDVALPLLAALAVAEVAVDPGQEAPRERHAEVLGGEFVVAQDPRDLAVDVEDRGGRILESACAA
jgi:hypothetical protein